MWTSSIGAVAILLSMSLWSDVQSVPITWSETQHLCSHFKYHLAHLTAFNICAIFSFWYGASLTKGRIFVRFPDDGEHTIVCGHCRLKHTSWQAHAVEQELRHENKTLTYRLLFYGQTVLSVLWSVSVHGWFMAIVPKNEIFCVAICFCCERVWIRSVDRLVCDVWHDV